MGTTTGGADAQEAAGQSTRGVAYWRRGSDERIISIRGEYFTRSMQRRGCRIAISAKTVEFTQTAHTPTTRRTSVCPALSS